MAITTQEMTAGMRIAAGLQGDVARGLGLNREQAAILNATSEHIRTLQGQAALLELAGGENGATLVEHFIQGGWETALKTQMYTGFDAAGNRIPNTLNPTTPTEAQNYAKAETEMRAHVNYERNGFDALTGPEQTILRNKMHNFLVSNPTFRMALAPPGTVTIPNAAVEASLRDEGLQRQLAAKLNDLFKPETIATNSAGTTYFEADIQRAEAVRKRDELNTNLTSESARLLAANAELTAFNANPTYTVTSVAGRAAESKGSAVTFLEADMSTTGVTTDVQNFGVHLKEALSLRQKIVATNPPPAANAPELIRLNALNNLLTTAKGRPVQDGAKCKEFEELYTEQFLITQKRNSAAAEVARLPAEIGKANIEVAMKKASMDLVSAKDQATSGNLGFLVDQALQEAAKSHLAKKAKDFIGKYQTEKTNKVFAKSVASDYNDQIGRYMEERWTRSHPRSFMHNWHTSTTSVNKRQAERDFATFMGRGEDVLVEDILTRARIPAAERALIMQDSATLTDLRSKALGGMLAAYVASGSRLRSRQLAAITASPYGQSAVSAMETAREQDKARKTSAVAAGFSNKPDLHDRMVKGTPEWFARQRTIKALLSPMLLLRPGAIGVGRLLGTMDVR